MAPSTRTFNSLYGGFNGSERLVHRSKQLLNILDREQLMPTIVSYGIVLQACALASDWEYAFQVKQRLDNTVLKQGPKIFGPLLGLAGMSGDVQRIGAGWQWVKDAKCSRSVELYGALMRSLGDCGNVQLAEATLLEMEEEFNLKSNKVSCPVVPVLVHFYIVLRFT